MRENEQLQDSEKRILQVCGSRELRLIYQFALYLVRVVDDELE